MEPELSAIVITRNEQVRIGACLDACVRATEAAKREGLIREGEVLLVDSASTDRTIEIARAHPVTIVRLPPEWPLSSAAGRFVGVRHARGSLLLFVDGDYVLFPDWLPAAIRALRADDRVAAVCGRDIEEFTGDSVLTRHGKALVDSLRREPTAIPVGLYRRSALAAVGGIHPFLRGAEDRDVAYRLREAGLRLVRIDRDMGTHRWADEGPLDFVTYFRSVLWWSIGDGQLFRIRRDVPSLVADIRRRYANVRYVRNYLVGLGLAVIVLANLAALLGVAMWAAAGADLGVLIALVAAKAMRRAPWREFLFHLHVVPYSVIRHGGFLAGFLRSPAHPSRYPTGEAVEPPGSAGP